MDKIWLEVLKVFLNLGAVGAFAFFYLRNAQKKDEMTNKNYQQLLDSVITDIKEDIKTSNDKNSKSLEFFNLSLDQIIEEMNDTREQVILTNAQVLNAIIDDRMLSKRLFFEISDLIIKLNIERVKIEVFDTLDISGFHSEEEVKTLRETVVRTMEKHRSYARIRVLDLNFDRDVLDDYGERAKHLWSEHLKDMEKHLESVTLESLNHDKNYNYRQTKIQLKNKVDQYKDNLIGLIKKVLREDRE